MAGTIRECGHKHGCEIEVSMESGLDGRNNQPALLLGIGARKDVSMESGLDGRNNRTGIPSTRRPWSSLNGVRPRWPEQYRFDRPQWHRR